jgi:putative flippase GtrA
MLKRQFILYCLIGGLGTGLTIAIYTVLVGVFQTHYQWANAIGYATGTAVSFVLNAQLNFKTTDRTTARFVSFCTVAALGWAVSAGLLHLLVKVRGWPALQSYAVVIVAVLLLQYNLNRLISFRSSPKRHA